PGPLAVQVPQQRFEDDAQAGRQPRDLAEALPLHFRQRRERSVAEALFEVHGGAHIGDLTVRCYSRRGRARPRRLDAAAASECSRARRGSPDGFLHFRTSATVAKPGAGVRAPVRDPAGGAAGEIRSCFSMTEPERAGSNPTWMDTRAVLEDGQWIIDGHKWFTSAADGAAFAVVMAVTDPEAPPHLRASMIIVPCDTPGFERVRNIPVMGHAGEGWPTHAEIRYTHCRVPKENLLGGRGVGFALAQERLGPGRIHHCMRWIGICERAFEMMCRHA